jgi:hypothetical protein
VLWTHLSCVVHVPLLTVQIGAVVVVLLFVVVAKVVVAKVVVVAVLVVPVMLVEVLLSVTVVTISAHSFQPVYSVLESEYQSMLPEGTKPCRL